MSNNKQQPKPENPNNQFSNTEPLTHAQRVAIANTMSNNKQSSVEWFLDQLIEHRIIIVDKTTYQVKYKHEIILERAKAMHKDEIIDAHGVQYDYSYSQIDPKKVTGEQYYNETYGGNNE